MDLLLQRTASRACSSRYSVWCTWTEAVNPSHNSCIHISEQCTQTEMIRPVCSMEDAHGVLAVSLFVGALRLALTAQQSQDLVVTPPTGCRVC